MGRSLGSYVAELLKYGGVCIVALAIGGALVGAAQLLLAGDAIWTGFVVAVMGPPIVGMIAVGGLCWAIGHMLLRDRSASTTERMGR